MQPPSHEISRPLIELVLGAAEKAQPGEACGVLLRGSRGELVALELPNRSGATDRFLMAPEDLAPLLAGRPWVGTWHSHPAGPAFPSSWDQDAVWEKGLCMIVSRENPKDPFQVSLWTLLKGAYSLLERVSI